MLKSGKEEGNFLTLLKEEVWEVIFQDHLNMGYQIVQFKKPGFKLFFAPSDVLFSDFPDT
jgi:hypothetical protein